MQVLWRVGLTLVLTLAIASTGFAQVQPVQTVQTVQAVPNRIPQQILVNGQQVNGAYVASPNGGMQSFTCSSPQEFVTPDGAARGWACFDASTGTWLLNSLPPAPQPVVVQQPTVVYQSPSPTIVYQSPAVVYAEPVQTVYVTRPVYRSSVVIGAAVINAAGRIASAAIRGSHYNSHVYYRAPVVIERGRGGRRHR
ncbi:MAG: hypothetical protein JW395_0550 [Nitrospira sp.]|nr:hypothetical protein [Nitrospira sp.]